jgi:ParB family chromosome partitioning protein
MSTPLRRGETSPLDLPLDLIDEDPKQPRKKDNPGFSTESLQELAGTIRLRGVKTPISVRDSPTVPGRYIINHGARRFRASKLAGKTSIPGFVDNDYLAADQVIENVHRDALTPREIADYIGRELAKGRKKKDIAKDIGKSNSFVSLHARLLDLPESIAKIFQRGRCRDVALINELVVARRANPAEVEAWLRLDPEITRGEIKNLRTFLEKKRRDHVFVDDEDDDNGEEEAPDIVFVGGQAANEAAKEAAIAKKTQAPIRRHKTREQELLDVAKLLIIAGLVDADSGCPNLDRAELLGAFIVLGKLLVDDPRRGEWKQAGEAMLAEIEDSESEEDRGTQ